MRGHLYDLTDVDDAFLAIVGYTREDFERGLSWRELTPPEYLHLDEAGMRQAAVGGFTAPYQKEFFRKDGTRVPVLLVCAFIPGMDGHWMGYVVSLEAPRPLQASPADATEPLDTHLKVELLGRLVSELVRERARTFAMLDHAPMLVWSVDRDARLLGANTPFHDAHADVGRLLEVGDRLDAPLPFTSDPSAWWSAHARSLREPFVLELRGAEAAWESRFAPIHDATGDVVGATVVAHEITARLRAEERVRASEALFRSLAESLPVGVCLVDDEGAVTYTNRAFAGLGTDDGSSPELRDALRAAAAELRGNEQVVVLEHTRELALGSATDGARARTLRIRMTRLEGDACLGIVEDETDRVAEARRAQQREKMESLGALAGGVAHDFNNLLGIVLGFTERALEDPTSTTESLGSIRTAVLRGRALVQQILTFGRRHEHAPKPLDLGALVTETSQLLRVAIPSTIVLETHVPREPVVVRGDAASLQHAIVNLCTNAAYALRGRPLGSIVVRCEATHDHVLLTVSDDGPGFAPALAGRLFEPFFTTKPFGEGTGMGLAVVHGIVTSHGGEVSAESSPRGATFTLRLPRAGGPPATTSSHSTPPPRVRARILLVEDEPLLVRLLTRTLTAAGHQVTTFASADEAWPWLADETHRVDLVLTDLTMPGMSGRELLRRTRALRPSVRGVLMSGNAELGGHDAEPDPFVVLEKPFLTSELLDALDRVLAS